MTKYAKQAMASKVDEEHVLTLDEVKALPGMIGRIASAMVAHHGVYTYQLMPSGRLVRIVLAR